MEFEWKAEYSVGVNEIDNQHKKFFMIINSLYETIKMGEDKESMVRILADLAAYANFHFSTEEKYFEEFKYKESEAHTVMHEEYKRKLSEFIERLQTDGLELSEDIVSFSREWLSVHILKEDKKYSETFLEHGLS
jgi:hemerythrin-like metal-binding protein